MERENTNPTKEDINSPNDYIVYLPLSYNYIKTDDVVHIRASTIRIYYFHKLKLNKLDKFIREKFNILGTGETEKNLDTDYFMNYYDFNILTNDDWWCLILVTNR